MKDKGPIIGNRVELQLLTTLRCNLACSYCSEQVGDVLGSQRDPQYSLNQLNWFVNTHLSGLDTYVTYYGGEPTLNSDFMAAVMKRFPTFTYQLQTNATLLDRVSPWDLKKFSNILVSVDGGPKITDGYRGKGIYAKVMENVLKARKHVEGSITARVTWGSPDTTFEELDELTNHFDYLYFQFVCGDSYQGDSIARRKEVLIKLIEKFFSTPSRLYPIVPIMGAVRNKLFPEMAKAMCSGETQCRASTHLLNVAPSGKIFPCPDMMYDSSLQIGSIQENWLKASPLRRPEGGKCESCAAFAWCRGNCVKNLILGAKDPAHQEKVVTPICDLIRFMGEAVSKYDLTGWYTSLPMEARIKLTSSPLYKFCEVMP